MTLFWFSFKILLDALPCFIWFMTRMCFHQSHILFMFLVLQRNVQKGKQKKQHKQCACWFKDITEAHSVSLRKGKRRISTNKTLKTLYCCLLFVRLFHLLTAAVGVYKFGQNEYETISIFYFSFRSIRSLIAPPPRAGLSAPWTLSLCYIPKLCPGPALSP